MNIKKLTKAVASVLLLSAAFMAVGCQDDGDRVFSLFAENFEGNGKLSVNGKSATWVNGDQIKINGETKSVAVDGSGNASVSAVSRAEYYRAVYPASICNGSLASNSVTVNLPSNYTYTTSGGHQILHSPMAAYMVDDGVTDQIFFKHLTGAIVVRITNNVAFDLNVNQIIISSDSYNISGNLSIDMSNLASVSPVSGGNSVTMAFATPLVLAASGGSADIQIPVAAVGAGNKFTIQVMTNFQTASGNTKYLVFSKQQATGGALNRGQVAYAMVNMSRTSADCVEDIPLQYVSGAYEISTPEQYLIFVETVNTDASTAHGNGRNLYFRLAANIDMNGYTVAPIHDYHRTFDGNNHTISNLHVVQDGSAADTNGLGMFSTHGSYAYTLVQNLTLQNLTLEYTGPAVRDVCIGGFVGRYQASGVTAINNCHINGMSIVSSTLGNAGQDAYYVGGLVGKIRGGNHCTIEDSHVSNLTFNITTTPTTMAFGGLVGNAENSGKNLILTDCSYSNPSALNLYYRKSLTMLYGGLIGQNMGRNLTLTSCSATQNVSVGGNSSSYVAGVIGVLQTAAGTASLISVTSSGTITYRGDKNGGNDPIACEKGYTYTKNYINVTTSGLTLTPYNF